MLDIGDIVTHLEKLTEWYFLEPNDQTTRDRIKGEFEQGLDTFRTGADHLRFAKRTYPNRPNIFDYSVVCDESNNPPNIVDRNELKIDVAIKPDRTANFIFVPIKVGGAAR